MGIGGSGQGWKPSETTPWTLGSSTTHTHNLFSTGEGTLGESEAGGRPRVGSTTDESQGTPTFRDLSLSPFRESDHDTRVRHKTPQASWRFGRILDDLLRLSVRGRELGSCIETKTD